MEKINPRSTIGFLAFLTSLGCVSSGLITDQSTPIPVHTPTDEPIIPNPTIRVTSTPRPTSTPCVDCKNESQYDRVLSLYSDPDSLQQIANDEIVVNWVDSSGSYPDISEYAMFVLSTTDEIVDELGHLGISIVPDNYPEGDSRLDIYLNATHAYGYTGTDFDAIETDDVSCKSRPAWVALGSKLYEDYLANGSELTELTLRHEILTHILEYYYLGTTPFEEIETLDFPFLESEGFAYAIEADNIISQGSNLSDYDQFFRASDKIFDYNQVTSQDSEASMFGFIQWASEIVGQSPFELQIELLELLSDQICQTDLEGIDYSEQWVEDLGEQIFVQYLIDNSDMSFMSEVDSMGDLYSLWLLGPDTNNVDQRYLGIDYYDRLDPEMLINISESVTEIYADDFEYAYGYYTFGQVGEDGTVRFDFDEDALSVSMIDDGEFRFIHDDQEVLISEGDSLFILNETRDFQSIQITD
ncbi:hypothetical protein GF362_05990 [Candidatus Dojkabacteria bacterium]|nr:hypothetical protein [Candidatus Dojkabacteria bacterium]